MHWLLGQSSLLQTHSSPRCIPTLTPRPEISQLFLIRFPSLSKLLIHQPLNYPTCSSPPAAWVLFPSISSPIQLGQSPQTFSKRFSKNVFHYIILTHYLASGGRLSLEKHYFELYIRFYHNSKWSNKPHLGYHSTNTICVLRIQASYSWRLSL